MEVNASFKFAYSTGHFLRSVQNLVNTITEKVYDVTSMKKKQINNVLQVNAIILLQAAHIIMMKMWNYIQ